MLFRGWFARPRREQQLRGNRKALVNIRHECDSHVSGFLQFLPHVLGCEEVMLAVNRHERSRPAGARVLRTCVWNTDKGNSVVANELDKFLEQARLFIRYFCFDSLQGLWHDSA